MTAQISTVLKYAWLDMTIWIAAIIYLHFLQHRKYNIGREIGAIIVSTLLNLIHHLCLPGLFYNSLFSVIYYLVLASAFFYLCGKITIFAAVYGAVWAIITEQIILEAWLVLYYKAGIHTGLFKTQWYWLDSILMFAVLFVILALTVARFLPEKEQYKIGPRQLSSAILLFAVFELMFMMLIHERKFILEEDNWLPILLAQCYCITVLYLQSELFKKSAMRQELAILNHLWHQQEAQYNLSKENIAMINHKVHDLKHQMRAIQDIATNEERNQYLEEIRNSIAIYEAIVHTGNEVLDTVLTEKSLYCEANEIKISCIADGSQMGFMDPIDLYAIFGNALDNAIESVSKFANKDARMIDVLICVEQQFLVINIINPVQGTLKFEENLPISTKMNNGQHGFGLKSIQHTVKKYDGFVKVKVEDDCFNLKILIPLNNNNES